MKKIKLTETELTKIIAKVIKEDAGMDTPGGNPDFFYDEDSLLAKMRRKSEEQDSGSCANCNEVADDVVEIYSLAQDGATELVKSRLERLLYKLGKFK